MKTESPSIQSLQLDASQSPQFGREQYVGFIGGRGQVKNLWAESGSWVYAVEIARHLAYGMSVYSKKTTILLHEAELWEDTEALLPDLARSSSFKLGREQLVG
ncbi:MAG: hypothetical protein AAFY11_02930 [Cyanobacteria bacterium J06641_5]